MSVFMILIHVVACIALILIVLLQTGKGADMGAAFGGGSSQTLFGSTGASTFLSKATTVVAVLFMITSLTLAYMSGRTTGSSIMSREAAPATQTAAPASETDTAAPEADAAAPAAEATTSETEAPASAAADTATAEEAPAAPDTTDNN